MGSTDDSTLRSVPHGQVDALLDSDQFPITTDAVIEEVGDVVVEYPDSTESLTAILELSGAETYADQLQLRHAILNGVGVDAVGRPRYSDRGLEGDYRGRMSGSF